MSILAAALFAAAAQTPSPAPSPPVYWGAPAVRFGVESRPLGFDPDGNARWLVVARFYDARGRRTRIMANSDLDWISSGAYVQWQTRLRFGQPSAILKTARNGPVSMLVRCNIPSLGTARISTDTRRWSGPRAVAAALGPYAVQIGWFPRSDGPVRLIRIDGAGNTSVAAAIAGPSSSYRDTHVRPGRRYRYVVYRAGSPPARIAPVDVPALPPHTAVSNVSGKGMWLYFTANPVDDLYYKHLNPSAIVDRAVRAGLRYVELRTAYGAYWEITPEAKPAIDAIIDGLAAHGIGTIGWTVPRDATFEDVEQTVRSAYYRTARGTPLTGIAVDLERGGEFMGPAPHGLDELWLYLQSVRDALGPRYLIASNIEDPYLEHLDRRKYPYEQIARYSDVLQPMTYWRMLSPAPFKADVAQTVRASYALVARLARRPIAIGVGGQTNALGPNGAPPPDEITASLQAAKDAGAIGECFFAWDGTQLPQWSALSAFRW